MNYDFDTFVPRRGTDCEKWDSLADGVLPLWVADMDFRAAPAIVMPCATAWTRACSAMPCRLHRGMKASSAGWRGGMD